MTELYGVAGRRGGRGILSRAFRVSDTILSSEENRTRDLPVEKEGTTEACISSDFTQQQSESHGLGLQRQQ